MNLLANREALHRGFQRLGGVVSSSIQQPLYRNVKIEASSDGVTLSGTDLEVALSLKVPEVEVRRGGAVLVPHARMASVLAASPDEKISIREADGSVVIETGDSVFRILGEDPHDFPDLPELPAREVVEIDPDVLRYMIRRTAFAAAAEKGRYALNGVYMAIGKQDVLEMVAADGARLAHVKKKLSNPEGITTSFIVLTKGVELLARLAEYGKGPVKFGVAGNQLIAENEVGRLACQLVEGQFPAYQDVIPTDSKVKVQLDAKELLSGVRRAALVTTDQTRVVDFSFSKGTLTLTAEAPDVGHAEVRIPVEYDGPAAQISFNPDYIDDMLSIVERDTVRMQFTDRRTPCLFKAGLDYTYVVSPVIREEGEV